MFSPATTRTASNKLYESVNASNAANSAIAKNCRSSMTCSHRSVSHDQKDCPNKFKLDSAKCSNCSARNQHNPKSNYSQSYFLELSMPAMHPADQLFETTARLWLMAHPNYPAAHFVQRSTSSNLNHCKEATLNLIRVTHRLNAVLLIREPYHYGGSLPLWPKRYRTERKDSQRKEHDSTDSSHHIHITQHPAPQNIVNTCPTPLLLSSVFQISHA